MKTTTTVQKMEGYIIVHLQTGVWNGFWSPKATAEASLKWHSDRYHGQWVLAEAICYMGERMRSDRFYGEPESGKALEPYERRRKADR